MGGNHKMQARDQRWKGGALALFRHLVILLSLRDIDLSFYSYTEFWANDEADTKARGRR